MLQVKTQVYRSQHDISAYEQDLNSNDASVVAAAEAEVAKLFDAWHSSGDSSQSANGSSSNLIVNPDEVKKQLNQYIKDRDSK